MILTVNKNELPQHIQRMLSRITRKRKFTVSCNYDDGDSVETFGTWWDGGSKYAYSRFSCTDGSVYMLNYGALEVARELAYGHKTYNVPITHDMGVLKSSEGSYKGYTLIITSQTAKQWGLAE